MAGKMTKVVAYTIAAAFVILLLSQDHNKLFRKDYSPRGLSRRLGTQGTAPPIFDPIVARRKGLANPEKSDDDDRYFNDKGRLDTGLRLMVLFPILDRDPCDGFVDVKELEYWNTQQAINRLNYRTQRALSLRDKDGDGSISFSEYFPQFTDEDIERNETGHGDAGWWMIQFKNADVDRNGTLNLYEFRDFLHPEDSRNDNIRRWLLTEKLRQMDVNKDQKLSLLEFERGAYETYKTYKEFETSGIDVPSVEETFTLLDADKDSFLRVEELKPIFHYLDPGELSYARYYTTYLIREADDNNDGKLTLDEMMNHDTLFYDTIYDNEKDEDDIYHDEL
ncbi:PREDICTED: reticulocalbin-2 [Ipomoea nil]|uniref:reticulocalbin-2 n=1 Tax=Ipomoea nil TaxID=35883 RepID=UPI000900FF79|nr:PREDICTED: reticulocalbin-2 [Ipomoea nil]